MLLLLKQILSTEMSPSSQSVYGHSLGGIDKYMVCYVTQVYIDYNLRIGGERIR